MRSENWKGIVGMAVGVVSERGVSGGVGDAGASEPKNGCAEALMEAHLLLWLRLSMSR